jgi:hypothetical protein
MTRYIVRAVNSPFHPHPRTYDRLDEAMEQARYYSRFPLDVGTPAYDVREVDTDHSVALAVAGVVYVREKIQGK